MTVRRETMFTNASGESTITNTIVSYIVHILSEAARDNHISDLDNEFCDLHSCVDPKDLLRSND